MIIAQQGRRPSGLLGEIVVRIMAKETVTENDMALELLGLQPDDAVLELGSGHGDTLAKAARTVTRGQLAGIDFSPLMHRHSKQRHHALVGSGRIEFRLGSSDALPFDDGRFGKVFTVHTLYFWTSPLDHLREAHRVLRSGGRLVIGFRPGDDPAFSATFPPEVYCIRRSAEVEALVRQAGFDSVAIVDRKVGGKAMCFAVAMRP